MRFIDSNILAYAFYDNKNRGRCQELISESGIVNTLNLIEAYNIIEYETSTEHATKAVKSLLKSNLDIISVDINLVFEALKKAPTHRRLKFIDLIHYVTALVSNCSEIASYDKDFDELDINRVT